MTTIQEQYTEIAQQSQQAALTTVDAWTNALEEAHGRLPYAELPLDQNQVIDQVFDFAEKLLGAQREFAKSLVRSPTAVEPTVPQTASSTKKAAAQA